MSLFACPFCGIPTDTHSGVEITVTMSSMSQAMVICEECAEDFSVSSDKKGEA